jgi:hypothetical protein
MLFYIIQKLLYQCCAFFEGLLPYIIVWPYSSEASVDPTSQIRLSAMLVLPIVGS